jgi:hypothetical protein
MIEQLLDNLITEDKFNIILFYANLLCPNLYNSKYDNEYYLINILSLLNINVSWKSLQYSKLINSNSKYHYKTIQKKHHIWAKCNVYYYAYLRITKDNKITEDLFIDNTLIINKYGCENVGYGNGESRKKKYTSLTIVINNNNKPVVIFDNKTNNKLINKNNIKTLPHDTNSLMLSIKKLNKKILNKTNIIGDKGFIINPLKINNLNINLITPKRTNQKIRNTEQEKIKIKKRSLIERWIGKIKNFNRVMVRRDKLIQTYMGFVYLGCICIN